MPISTSTRSAELVGGRTAAGRGSIPMSASLCAMFGRCSSNSAARSSSFIACVIRAAAVGCGISSRISASIIGSELLDLNDSIIAERSRIERHRRRHAPAAGRTAHGAGQRRPSGPRARRRRGRGLSGAGAPRSAPAARRERRASSTPTRSSSWTSAASLRSSSPAGCASSTCTPSCCRTTRRWPS